MNPFLRYLADKHSAHRHTDTQTDTPMTTRPCGLRRAGKTVYNTLQEHVNEYVTEDCFAAVTTTQLISV